jgi:hypothetical protein
MVRDRGNYEYGFDLAVLHSMLSDGRLDESPTLQLICNP